MNLPDPGRVGFPANLVGGRATATSLRPGSQITLNTTRNALTGRIELSGRGIRLAPVGSLELPPGGQVRLLVLSTTPQVRLKLLAHFPPSHLSDSSSSLRSVGQVVNSLGLHHGDGAEEVVRALLNSHRELPPALIRALAVRIDRDLPERGRQRRARLLVELADKGMDPDREELRSEELLPYLTDGRWGQRGSEHQHRPPQGTSQREPLTSLRSFLQRATATPGHSVQLFNHLRGNGNLHWVVIPIGAHRHAHATTGTLRVGLDTTDNTAREATLAVAVGAGVWWFSWVIDQGTARMVSSEADTDAPEIPQSLLARMSGRGHTDTRPYQNGDGFSALSSEVQKLGVDEYG